MFTHRIIKQISRLPLFCLGLGFCGLGARGAAQELGRPEDREFIAQSDGSSQRYVLILPKEFDAATTHPLVIALHGHGSDRWQFARDMRAECRGARDAAAKYNAIYVSPDYRAPASWMGPAAESDLLEIIADLKKEFRVGKTILMGGSMGGTSSLIFTLLHSGLIDGVVSLNAMANMVEYQNFQDFIAASYGATKAQAPQAYRKRSAEFYPERFTMPIAFTVGGQDTIVPPGSVLRLAAKLKQSNPNVLLIDRPATGHETNYADTVAAMDFVLSRAIKTAPPRKADKP